MKDPSRPESLSEPERGKRPSKPASSAQDYMKYSGMAIQMGAIILLGVWSGRKLDERFQSDTPWFTVGLALFSIFAALYVALKDLFKKPS